MPANTVEEIVKNEIDRTLYTSEQIDRKVAELAECISRDYRGKNLLLVGVLKGSIVFMSDLMKKLSIPARIDFMIASSYGDTTLTQGKIQVRLDLSVKDPENYHILLVEDILDTGITISSVCDLLRSKNPLSFKTCVLLDKKARRRTEVEADYVGFDIPDYFVVGYGMDYAERYRTLPFIGVLRPEMYS